jgi:hypothetical protein
LEAKPRRICEALGEMYSSAAVRRILQNTQHEEYISRLKVVHHRSRVLKNISTEFHIQFPRTAILEYLTDEDAKGYSHQNQMRVIERPKISFKGMIGPASSFRPSPTLTKGPIPSSSLLPGFLSIASLVPLVDTPFE